MATNFWIKNIFCSPAKICEFSKFPTYLVNFLTLVLTRKWPAIPKIFQGFVSEHTILAAVLLQSLIFLLQPPKLAPAVLPAPSSCGPL